MKNVVLFCYYISLLLNIVTMVNVKNSSQEFLLLSTTRCPASKKRCSVVCTPQGCSSVPRFVKG